MNNNVEQVMQNCFIKKKDFDQHFIYSQVNQSSKDSWQSQTSYNYQTMFPDRHANQIKIAYQDFLPKLNSNSLIADFGCGDGWFTCIISPNVAKIDAFDVSKNYLEIAYSLAKKGNLNNIHFYQADLFKEDIYKILPVYDAAMAMGLFTYVFDNNEFDSVVKKISQQIKVNGYLFLKDSLCNGEDLIYSSSGYIAIYRNFDSYVDIFKKHGFEVESKGILSSQISENGTFSGYVVLKKQN